MMFIGAIEYYFWEGIRAAVLGTDQSQQPSPIGRLTLVKECSEAYLDGFNIGLDISLKEYKELVK